MSPSKSLNTTFSYREFLKIRSTILGGPHNKDCSVLGSILEFPYFGNYKSAIQAEGSIRYHGASFSGEDDEEAVALHPLPRQPKTPSCISSPSGSTLNPELQNPKP